MKERAFEARGGFFGGLNLSVSADTINPNELLVCENARVLPNGAVQRRAGFSKLNTSVFGAGGAVRGVFGWEPAGGIARQIVVIANGKLYYGSSLNMLANTMTEVTPASGSFSTTRLSDFATFREGTTLWLYIASGGTVYKWDGVGHVLTRIDGSLTVPDATAVRSYGTRMFYNSLTNPKTLFWSKIGTGSDCTVGGLSDGGSALVDVLTGESISALETLGASLLIATATSIARFSGTSDDIRIAQDTAGISADVGPVSDAGFPFSGSFQRVGEVVMMWTAQGPYVVTEAGISFLGAKLQPQHSAPGSPLWQGAAWAAFIGHNRARNEVWFTFTNRGGTQSTLVYNYVQQTWSGPFTTLTTFTCYITMSWSDEAMLFAGCSDGFIRNVDDDNASRDDGPTDYTHRVQPAPFIFANAGPHNLKTLRRVFVQTQEAFPGTGPTVTVTADNEVVETLALIEASNDGADAPSNRRYDGNSQGRRFVVEVSGTFASQVDGDLPMVHGVLMDASVMDRW